MLDSCLEEVLAGPPQLRQAPAFLAFLQSCSPDATDASAALPLPGFGGSLRLLTGATEVCKGFTSCSSIFCYFDLQNMISRECLLRSCSHIRPVCKRIQWQQQQQQPATRINLLHSIA